MMGRTFNLSCMSRISRTRAWATCLMFVALTIFALPPAQAHKASDSYLVLDVKGQTVTGQWDIAVRDIDFALGLDADGNAEVTWGELRNRQADIASWAFSRLNLQRGGDCLLKLTAMQVDDHTDGGYAVLKFAGDCPKADGSLGLNYRLLFDLDALHRGLLRLTLDGINHTAMLSPDARNPSFEPGERSRLAQFKEFLVQGVWHIWIGLDHILFLLALLLPAVLIQALPASASKWRGADKFSQAFREVLWVVTSFTVAHSITLSLAALGLISLPSRLVESAIAVSVILAAANNLWPVVQGRRWLVAFVFGLIHGFGFASVLAELGLPQDALVLSLVGFNLGVEAGQLAIVSAFLPVAFLLRNTRLYQRGIFVGGSIITMGVAAIWLAERVFDLKIITA
jgi:hypothetical protein